MTPKYLHNERPLHSFLRDHGLMMSVLYALSLSIALGFLPANGAEIYRWVDENGRVHFSDTAPRQSKNTVTRIDSSQYELSPAQRKEAEARTASAHARSVEISERKAEEESAAAKPVPNNVAAKPKESPADCATLLQRFQQSSECYAPFFNANGSVKPNAVETCGPAVPYPATECS